MLAGLRFLRCVRRSGWLRSRRFGPRRPRLREPYARLKRGRRSYASGAHFHARWRLSKHRDRAGGEPVPTCSGSSWKSYAGLKTRCHRGGLACFNENADRRRRPADWPPYFQGNLHLNSIPGTRIRAYEGRESSPPPSSTASQPGFWTAERRIRRVFQLLLAALADNLSMFRLDYLFLLDPGYLMLFSSLGVCARVMSWSSAPVAGSRPAAVAARAVSFRGAAYPLTIPYVPPAEPWFAALRRPRALPRLPCRR